MSAAVTPRLLVDLVLNDGRVLHYERLSPEESARIWYAERFSANWRAVSLYRRRKGIRRKGGNF